MSDHKNGTDSDASRPSQGEISEAEIDKTLMDSFPASDPPSWTLGSDRHEPSPDSATDQIERHKGK